MGSDIPLTWFLYFAAAAFSIGLAGVLIRRNAIAVMAIEIMLNAANVNLVAFGDIGRRNPDAGPPAAIGDFARSWPRRRRGIGLILLRLRRWHAADGVPRYDAIG